MITHLILESDTKTLVGVPAMLPPMPPAIPVPRMPVV